MKKQEIDFKLCVVCKTSRNLCGFSPCPLLKKWMDEMSVQVKKIDRIDDVYAPPAFFVGRYNYPEINAGPVLTPLKEPSSIVDDSDLWDNKTQEEIIMMRLSMIRTKAQIDAKKPLESRIMQKSHEMLLGIKPINVEIELERSIIPRVTIDPRLAPHGPVAPIRKLDVTENQTPLKPIEKAYYDTDLKASEAITILGKENISVSNLIRVLSAGMLGLRKKRKLVPTRWSITAVDDTLSKSYIEEIKKFQTINEFQVFTSYFYGNKFYIVLIPDFWSFEAIEVWYKGAYLNPSTKDVGISDYELYNGRKTYANNVAGGYYATRLAVTEHLRRIRRQAQVIAIREIDQNYKLPLGVWVVRQGARQAMQNQILKADTLDSAFSFIPKVLAYSIEYYKNKSKIYELKKKQKKLEDFL
ncbi:MAG: hypothetical protein K9W46_02375 [Candidatus Heimdallarchaeum endolithica]|uniref:DNA repair protein n=1 Tax=Candidatus Heimdallarchaeum endolithica TaxID=2876572 RepID=A0A9Y1FPX9_9ARCH|nr:MAG: hypothetical protein K9W46_02375 [Candidatus Heimdallarchaeum endolithica]